MKGICDTLKGSGAEILWSVSKENDSKEKINLQTQRRVDIVMALDNAIAFFIFLLSMITSDFTG